jgi:hypothetical protein
VADPIGNQSQSAPTPARRALVDEADLRSIKAATALAGTGSLIRYP